MTRILFVAVATAAALSSASARADAINTANPGNVWEVEASARNGLGNFEVAIRYPVNQDPPGVTLNPAGTPVWIYGDGYRFELDYTAATGTVTFKVDFDRNGAFEMAGTFGSEIATLNIPALAGFGFRYVGLHLEGSPNGETVDNFLTLNGVGFGSGTSGTGAVDSFFTDSVGAFADIVVTGNFVFFGDGGSEDVPRIAFQLGAVVPVPEPASALLLGTALIGIATRRQRVPVRRQSTAA